MASCFLFLRLLIGSSLTDCVPVDLRNCVVRTFASGIDIRYPLAPCVSNSFIFSFFFFFFNQISRHVSRSLNPSYFNFIWNFYYTSASSSSSECLDRDPLRCLLLLSDVSAIFLLWRAQKRSAGTSDFLFLLSFLASIVSIGSSQLATFFFLFDFLPPLICSRQRSNFTRVHFASFFFCRFVSPFSFRRPSQ